ncbi:hypothetical protein FTUN_7919 [Frigoriglobus tundricola]|uniref:Uncharacterized protein n=1 Tax=Frigoriglobus tundricola TaxID=2774151 RepID=A0A6M5Z4A1_9BACT|nr:hypothetical protein FTUN_7919 [Frigoriglobus tundricola]
MAGVKDCRRCGLVNPPSAQRCDCGYDFTTQTVERSYLGAAGTASLEWPSTSELVLCVLFPVLGLLLGLIARGRGRRAAGRVMLLTSASILLICNGPIFLAILVKATG